MSCARRARTAPARRPAARTYSRASGKMPLLWSGSPQQPWLAGRSTSSPLCSSTSTALLALSRLVVVRAAAVEVDDGAPRARAAGASVARPRCNVPPGPVRHRRLAVDAERLLDAALRTSDCRMRPVGDRRRPACPSAPGERGARDQPGRAAGCRGLAFSSARACELISAIFTPWGQTWVQMPQLEQ